MKSYQIGLDIGSTTIKLVVMDQARIVFERYCRHKSDIRGEMKRLLQELAEQKPGLTGSWAITGSGGLSIARWLNVAFIQEVVAATNAVQSAVPAVDVMIELGGEDAKIIYTKPVTEQRMNGICAGGTGAFIDQMAMLLQTDSSGLDELAARHTTLYPLASRCGVFAKSDLQPLLNEGTPREDLAASVLQAVVNQTIAGLAQGRPITGHVVFLGGPLYFLPQLRERFAATLKDCQFHTPENAQLFVAIGAAQLAVEEPLSIDYLIERLEGDWIQPEVQRMPPLFANTAELEAFRTRHSKAKLQHASIKQHTGPCFLGIDAGSTTIKSVLLNEKGELLYTYYHGNEGSPVQSAVRILREIYQQLPAEAYIGRACVTGYGEGLIMAALNADQGEIETIAHYQGAKFFCPEAQFILDIGGQDMKCMAVQDGVISSIMLNESCSSGCGSFIETFAHGLGFDASAFAQQALLSAQPVDLGTRCTVFMNSRVKQAQKEGATVADISAGLSYSVVRNALYKVIKMKDAESLGTHVVVQGGAFLNDSVLRCFEQVTGREVIRPEIAGLMGAFGAARLACRDYTGGKSAIMQSELLDTFSVHTEPARCHRCNNNCQLTISHFSEKRKFVSGNRCERGAGVETMRKDIPNLFEYKYMRAFRYDALPESEAPRGVMGVPRVLNMFENYPFWHTLLTKLGFSVRLSGRSDDELFRRGMDTIPSESVCYPAKLAHGHIMDLIDKGTPRIFYPSVAYEMKEYEGANNHFNCPIVVSYPEVLRNNVDALKNVQFINLFCTLDSPYHLINQLLEAFSQFGVTAHELDGAVKMAYAELNRFKSDIRSEGDRALEWIEDHKARGIVLAGRPYHDDPMIHHGIPRMINGMGFAVLTEDSVAHRGNLQRSIRVVDQWAYHTRLYEAAAYVAKHPRLEMVQLNSFGCGLDAVTIEQVQEILASGQRAHTVLKIDEISSLGTARIRLRSLKAALEERDRNAKPPRIVGSPALKRVPFTKAMAKTHTLLAPQMAPVQFRLLEAAFIGNNIEVQILDKVTPADVECGLKYVNNDACYPSIMVVGQLVNAFISGRYDPDNTSVCITQTGGGCRATNYIAFLRKALKDSGFGQVAVVSLSLTKLEDNPGFKITLPMLKGAIYALALGDALQQMVLRVRPYELESGAADRLYEKWNTICCDMLAKKQTRKYKSTVKAMVREFDALPLQDIPRKARVGLVGEILVKFHPDANNDAIGVVEREGQEAVVPGLTDFFLYSLFNSRFQHKLGKSRMAMWISNIGISIMELIRRPIVKAFAKSARFTPPMPIAHIAQGAAKVLSLGHMTGEGWFLTGEMIELLETGVPNIICMQPFACLPNHVTGKGMLKELRRQYPLANIVPVDYDPGASEVNQVNRIKLMLAAAVRNQEKGDGTDKTKAPREAAGVLVYGETGQ